MIQIIPPKIIAYLIKTTPRQTSLCWSGRHALGPLAPIK